MMYALPLLKLLVFQAFAGIRPASTFSGDLFLRHLYKQYAFDDLPLDELENSSIGHTNYLTFGKSLVSRSLPRSPWFHHRSRRSDDPCKLINEDASRRIHKNAFPLKDDKNFNLAVLWVGGSSEKQLLLTTMGLNFFNIIFSHGSKSHSNLYESTDLGFTFTNIGSKVGNLDIRENSGIMKSPLNGNKVILISYYEAQWLGLVTNPSKLAITEDGGKSFDVIDLKFTIRQDEILQFHLTNENWILALEATSLQKKANAWISRDFGRTWRAMLTDRVAESVKWGTGSYRDFIYISVKAPSSFLGSEVSLFCSTDGGYYFDELFEVAYSFGIQGGFIFVSTSSKDDGDTRVMQVSTDGGKNFNPIHVPSINPERFFAILDMYRGMVFLHVDDPEDTGVGTLYISGRDGIMYTKSLENHFFTNSGFSDFYRIESMEGVYITQVLNRSDSTLTSVISFDRGVRWQPLYVSDEDCKSIVGVCTLHFHNSFSKTKFMQFQAPLSSANAPGLILLHGHPGDALMGRTDVWLSRNGGYNWTKVGDGPHHYAIGDHGNLIVLAPRLNGNGTTLRYSVDQGKCWNDLEFTPPNQPMVVRGLVTEPNSTMRAFSLWGYYDSADSTREWIVVTINFQNMFARICHEDDFEEWYPHALNNRSGCLLGEKVTYRRPKDESDCYIGGNFEPVVKREKCTCTNDDLECDYGFEKNAIGDCVHNPKFKLEVCKQGEEYQEEFSGKRLLPGDVCESTTATQEVRNFIDLHLNCGPALATKVAKSKPSANTGRHTGIIVMVAIVMVIGLCGGSYFVVKIWRASRYRDSYRMSALVEEDDDEEEVDAYSPRPTASRPYRDDTDRDDEELLPV